jgi:DNA-directed RNA polymerase specialized sigma24 family protein
VSRYAGAVLEQLSRVFNQGTVVGLTEGKLLERFVAAGDEAAFAALVARHGPMVLGVCRRILRDEHDVEDAFQATFLILVRRAGAIKNGELVGHWLHGVAHRVAVRSRVQAAYRAVRKSQPCLLPTQRPPPLAARSQPLCQERSRHKAPKVPRNRAKGRNYLARRSPGTKRVECSADRSINN